MHPFPIVVRDVLLRAGRVWDAGRGLPEVPDSGPIVDVLRLSPLHDGHPDLFLRVSHLVQSVAPLSFTFNIRVRHPAQVFGCVISTFRC